MVTFFHLLLRGFSTKSHRPFYVTTPIFYVNAAPHIGHLYSAVIADTVNRYQKLKYPKYSKDHFKLSTGTDEHGIKIQQAAANHKISVLHYCDKISREYENLFKLAGIGYTDFIRTTEERHKNTVKHFWNKLKANDYIYSSTYSGWYCVSDETFLTENQLKLNPQGIKVSIESGHPVEWTEEMNYLFKLSELQSDIIKWVQQGNRIKPKKFEKILLDYLVNEPLPDLSVSRPTSRVHWGINVPDNETQTIYVWLDALVNYLTCAGYPEFSEKSSNIWPPSLQVIGKDILKFHGIYWPAFLIAAGLEPPECLLVHSHWTVDGEKMSKSKHNVVDPLDRAQLYTMEGLRYFLLREGVAHSDGNYSDIKLLRILNSELADTLGNLLSRGCAKSLNPRQVYPKCNVQHFHDICKLDATKRLMEALNQLPEVCEQHYEDYNFYMVVDQIMRTLHAANNFFESCKPWELKKKPSNSNTKDTLSNDTEVVSTAIENRATSSNSESNKSSNDDENINKLETIISITMDTLRICGIILQPIVPEISKKLLDKLSVPHTERCWKNLKFSHYEENCEAGNNERKLGTSTDAVLFRRIIAGDGSIDGIRAARVASTDAQQENKSKKGKKLVKKNR